jgi:hypothetical protein
MISPKFFFRNDTSAKVLLKAIRHPELAESCPSGTRKIESPQAIPKGEGSRERTESTISSACLFPRIAPLLDQLPHANDAGGQPYPHLAIPPHTTS